MAKAKSKAEEPEVNEEDAAGEAQEQETNAEVKVAFETALGEEQGEDEIKMAMIQAGATFKNVTRLFNQFMIDAGLAISASDRKAIVDETLEGSALDTEDAFAAATKAVEAAVLGSNERSAAALVRAYAKKNELECYKAPAGEGGTRNPFVQNFHKALIENPKMTEEELRGIISNLDEQHQVNPLRWFNQHNNIRKTANAIAAKYEG